MQKKVNVVVFDFDGTLSASDSNFEFGRWCFRHRPLTWFYLPIVGFFSLFRKISPDGIWWRQGMRRFITKEMVHDLVPGFVKWHKTNRFGWAADQVEKEKKAGNIVVLISASPEHLIKPLVSDMKFDAILTSETESELPWKYKFLCYGKNKVIALDRWAAKNKYVPHVVRSYSDSKSDTPIMEISDEQVWIDRKTGLRK